MSCFQHECYRPDDHNPGVRQHLPGNAERSGRVLGRTDGSRHRFIKPWLLHVRCIFKHCIEVRINRWPSEVIRLLALHNLYAADEVVWRNIM